MGKNGEIGAESVCFLGILGEERSSNQWAAPILSRQGVTKC